MKESIMEEESNKSFDGPQINIKVNNKQKRSKSNSPDKQFDTKSRTSMLQNQRVSTNFLKSKKSHYKVQKLIQQKKTQDQFIEWVKSGQPQNKRIDQSKDISEYQIFEKIGQDGKIHRNFVTKQPLIEYSRNSELKPGKSAEKIPLFPQKVSTFSDQAKPNLHNTITNNKSHEVLESQMHFTANNRNKSLKQVQLSQD